MATRLIITLFILLAFDVYAFQAFRTLAQSWTPTARTILYGIYWIIPMILVFMIAAVYTDQVDQINKSLFSVVRAILFIAYFSKMIVAGVLFIDDLRRLWMFATSAISSKEVVDYSRSKFLARAGILLGSLPFVTLTYGILRNAYRYRLFKRTVKIDNLPESLKGLRIVQISDIHSGSFTMKEPVKAAIDLINDQKADLVFFTGDLVNSVADEMDDFMDVFDKINAKYGVYSVLGNHDYGDYHRWESPEARKANFQKLLKTHKDLGWDLLLNENRLIDINNEKVAVIGVENYSAKAHFPKYGDLKKAYQGTENAPLKLLLSHDPSHWDDQVINDFKDINITFSGHTHGMQFGIEIPGWIKWSPVKYMYTQWAGLYKKGTQYLYVNRGLGFLGYPGRVGILPEITVLDLDA